MNALEQFAQDNFNDGIQEGIQKEKAEGIQESIQRLARRFIKQSGNKLSMDEALAQAKKLITKLD